MPDGEILNELISPSIMILENLCFIRLSILLLICDTVNLTGIFIYKKMAYKIGHFDINYLFFFLCLFARNLFLRL